MSNITMSPVLCGSINKEHQSILVKKKKREGRRGKAGDGRGDEGWERE